jgi:hypothetical protein
LTPSPKVMQQTEGCLLDSRIDLELLITAFQIKQILDIEVTGLLFLSSKHFTRTFMSRAFRDSETFSTQKLSITDSLLEAGFLKNFLPRFDSLTHLTYEENHKHDHRLHLRFCGLAHANIRDGLSNSRHSLERLVLRAGTGWDTVHCDDPSWPLGSMTEFKNLKFLKVDAELLFGYEVDSGHAGLLPENYSQVQCSTLHGGLPNSLEFLIIHHCDHTIMEPIGQLVHSAAIPERLKNIEVSVNSLPQVIRRGK